MGSELVLPSHDDPVAGELSHAIGGPVGRHARTGTGGFWTPLRVMLAMTMLTFGLGWVMKAPCRSHPWANQYQYTRLCYSDVYALYFSERLSEGAVPYLDHDVEYPVVIGGLMWLVASVVDDAQAFYDLTSVVLLAAAMVTVVATAGAAGRRRRWDAALVALAPGLLLHGTTNWDLAAVAFASLGILAWARGRPAMSGLWWGLGIATKLYPLFFFGPLLLLCLRARRLREFAASFGTAAGAWLAVNALVAVQVRDGDFVVRDSWMTFYRLNRERTADWDSPYFVIQEMVKRWTGEPFTFGLTTLNLLVAGLFLLACAGIGALILMAPRRPRLAQVLFLVVAAFLLVNKVNSPQYTLWLIPLAVLARPRWRAFLVWQVLELGVMFTRFYFFVNLSAPPTGMPVTWFVMAILLRNAALLYLVVQVVREILRPELDVVRRDGVDDPAGGVLDASRDARELREMGLQLA